jgi:hypothetical protein
MSIDGFFHRKYNANTYNCAHFVCEVWESLTGQSLADRVEGLLRPRAERHVSFAMLRRLQRLERPISPCVVVMTRPRSAPHVGIYLDGRILHIEKEGVTYQPIEIASLGFKTMGYYK